MAAQLRAGKSATRRVRGIIRRETKKALEALDASRPPADAAIHEARKQLKKSRAALRLIRTDLGPRRFGRENGALRDAARPLSDVRDAKILVDAFDDLAKKAPWADRSVLTPVHRRLVAHQLDVRRRVLGPKSALKPVVRELESVRKRSRAWRVGGRGWKVLGSGIRHVYRSGRRALARARENPTVENLHEWRKQTKYLWHELQILEPIRPATMKKLGDQAHRLSDRLGDDHDLAVLLQRLMRARPRLPRTTMTAVSRMIEGRRRELRQQAMALAPEVYAERPRAFEEQLHEYWRAWRSSERKAAQANGRARAARLRT